MTALAMILVACHRPNAGLDDESTPDGSDDGSGDGSVVGDGGGSADSGMIEEPVVLEGVLVESVAWNTLAAKVTFTAPEDMVVTVEYGVDGALDYATPEHEGVGGAPISIYLVGLLATSPYQIRVRGQASDGTPYESEATPFLSGETLAWLPVPVIGPDVGGWANTEVVCSNTQDGHDGPYYCTDRSGALRFVLQDPEGGIIGTLRPLMDGGFAAQVGQKLRIWDGTGQLVASYLWQDIKAGCDCRFEHQEVDSHDIVEITKGEWAGKLVLLTHSVDMVGADEVDAHGFVVFDRATEEVVWDWSIHGALGDEETIDPAMLPYDHKGLYAEDDEWDHTNTVLYGEDEGGPFFWLSLPRQDWIIKVDVATDQVLWRFGRDGDFLLQDAEGNPLGDDGFMYQQHSPDWKSAETEGTGFFVFDNGQVRIGPDGEIWTGEPFSRVMEYELDQDALVATLRFSYGSSDTSDPAFFYATHHGDADLLPSGDAVQFLSWGRDESFIEEISYPDGEIRWKATVPTLSPDTPYRLQWYPSLYETTFKTDP